MDEKPGKIESVDELLQKVCSPIYTIWLVVKVHFICDFIQNKTLEGENVDWA